MKKIYVAMFGEVPAIAFDSKRNADEYADGKDATVEELIVVADYEYPSDSPTDKATGALRCSASEGGAK